MGISSPHEPITFLFTQNPAFILNQEVHVSHTIATSITHQRKKSVFHQALRLEKQGQWESFFPSPTV